MRVLQFNNKYTGTGAERVMKNLGQRMAQTGNEVFFATYENCGKDGPYYIGNPTVKIISMASLFDSARKSARSDYDVVEDPNKSFVKKVGINFRSFIPLQDPMTRKSFNRVLDESNPDIVHCHNTLPSLAPIVESKRRGIPVVVTLHGYWPICPLANRFQIKNQKICDETDWSRCKDYCSTKYSYIERSMQKLKRILTENVDCIICISSYMRDRLLDYGYPEESVKIIRNGINEEVFMPTGLPTNDCILHVGRLSIHKGSHMLFNVAKRLESKYPDIKFKLVGTGLGNKPIRLSKNIDYLGWVTDETLIRLYAESLCTIIPSIWPEPQGLVALEAMACGAPVIGTRIAGIEESIDDRKTGFLIDIVEMNEMVDDIASHIEELYRNPGLRQEMGESARNRVEVLFNEKKMLDEYLDVYSEITERTNRKYGDGG